MKLFVLRHANAIVNELGLITHTEPGTDNDLGLSHAGEKQAQELALRLRNYRFDVFIVSPLRRTIDTLTPYLQTVDSPKIIVSELVTERNAGEFAGQKVGVMKEYRDRHGITDRISFRPNGGESLLDVCERARKFVEYLKAEFKDESILVCSHMIFLQCLDAVITGKDVCDTYASPIENIEMKEYEL